MINSLNFLPEQYERGHDLSIRHSYLAEQFADYPLLFKKIESLIRRGDYTLGREVDEFEKRFSKLVGTNHAVGVGSGTDAIFLSLKALGVGLGDEVITTPYTFFATVGAIVTAGAKPVFVDIKDDYNMDPSQIERVITKKTKVILPVHWAGLPCDMNEILSISKKHKIMVVEDACHGIKATDRGRAVGSFGISGCFSMHPLKNLNVWGDGGVITTNDSELHKKLCLLRNHGLVNRDECGEFAYNSRLDTLQAIVADHLMDKLDFITDSRIRNSRYFDEKLSSIKEITIPERDPEKKQVFHIYVVRAERRNELQRYLQNRGIDAKVHYPIPMHLQPAARVYGYQKGDFPCCEQICGSVISLPVHEYVQSSQQDFIIDAIKSFYGNS